MTATLEHINLTVADNRKTADLLCMLFNWVIRWEGPSIEDGYSIHVGEPANPGGRYLAIYQSPTPREDKGARNTLTSGLNHLGILVEDIDQAERRVVAAGYKPFSHRDYEPGKRFYFMDENALEFEIISYTV